MEVSEGRQVPTHYANFVTSTLNTDELVMELRRFDRPHREWMSSEPVGPLPVPNVTDLMSREPIARVVMTFSAAKALKEYLDSVVPRLEEVRRTGKPLS